MEWENCVQLEQISCTFELMGLPCEERVENLQGDFPTAPLGDPRDVCDRECDMRGFYYDRGKAQIEIPFIFCIWTPSPF